MAFLRNLFRRREPICQATIEVPPPSSHRAGPRATITVFDSCGWRKDIPREEWRSKELPRFFHESWHDPDRLERVIFDAIKEGFFAECLKPARHLAHLDPQRGVALLCDVLLHLEKFAEVEKLLNESLRKYGPQGDLLVELAKAQSGLGKQVLAEATLERALELDPNHEYGLWWYASLHRQHGGKPAELGALRRVAAGSGAWLARVWLARHALDDQDLPSALLLCRQILQRTGGPPGDAAVQITGTFAKHGHFKEAVELCAPFFDAKRGHIKLGNNLLKAYVELGDTASARSVLEQLAAQHRPDWITILKFWEDQIVRLDKPVSPLNQRPAPKSITVSIEGPIWAREGMPFTELLEVKPPNSPRIVFCFGSVDVPGPNSEDPNAIWPVENIGHFPGGLMMFVAERVHLGTPARAELLAPWLPGMGCLLGSEPFTPQQPGAGPQRDYLLALHLVATAEPWIAQFKLFRLWDRKPLALWVAEFHRDNLAEGLERTTNELLARLASRTGLNWSPRPEWLQPPKGEALVAYMCGLRVALAVWCAGFSDEDASLPVTERSQLDALLGLCVREPCNVCARLLFLSTLERRIQDRPGLAHEYTEPLHRLQHDNPLPQPAQGLTDAAVARICRVDVRP